MPFTPITAVAVLTSNSSLTLPRSGRSSPPQKRPSSTRSLARSPRPSSAASSGTSTSLVWPMRKTRLSLMVISTRPPLPVRMASPGLTSSPRFSRTQTSVPARLICTGRTR